MTVYSKTKVKICGLTNMEDVRWSIEAGADMLGFILVPSRRYVEPAQVSKMIQQVPDTIRTVGVFMNQPLEEVEAAIEIANVDLVQLHGNEDPDFCQQIGMPVIKRITVTDDDSRESLIEKIKPYEAEAYLLDKGAGTGEMFDWQIARDIPYPLIIAGGLNPQNVKKVVTLLHPYAVDVSSGVEKELRKKDQMKIKTFIKEAQ